MNSLTLKNRIFLFSTLLLLLAFAMMWIFVRPQYKEAIIDERTTIVSQLQEYSLKRTDQIIRNWLNAANYMAEEIAATPAQTQSIVTKTINLTPGLMRIQLSEEGSDEAFDIRRSLYDDTDFSNIELSWYSSRLDPKINISWSADSLQDMHFFIAQRVIQLEDNILRLNLYYNASTITDNIINIPLGGKNVANIVSADGQNIAQSQPFDFPSYLVGDASYSNQSSVELNDSKWFVMTSRFQTVPFWHVIAVQDSFILQPVYDLILFSVISGVSILLILFAVSWYISNRVNQPVQQLITDVEQMSRLDFTLPIKPVNLPEFRLMRHTLEDIRLTLKRYQQINVEKIILEEWKNRYMMTYSEDLIGILNEEHQFGFLNNNFHAFLESLSLNPKKVTLEGLLKHKKISTSALQQSTQYPHPYTVKIKRFDLSHVINNNKNDYYDFQHVSIVDKEDVEQAALIILHDKTEDRLNDIKRNDMINIIVHELKNPITGVIGLSKLMIDNQSIDREEQAVLLNEINLSGERMNTLVNRFLEIQRLESGRISIDPESVNLHKVIQNICSITHSQLVEKNLETNIIKNGTDFTLKGSEELIFDAIQNLLSNAIKYGDRNRTIDMELTELDESLTLSITDYGYGIGLEDQKKVFEKFYRIKSNPKSAGEKGTGLGLAYVQEIMSRHHGKIELESNEEIGSRFTLVFPKVQLYEK